MKKWLNITLAAIMLAGAFPVAFSVSAYAQESKIMAYGVDVVTDYVARGQDLYIRTLVRDGQEHGALHMEPAVQPSLTFFGPNGVSLNLWGSFAASNRADDKKKGFVGLGRDDELDYTLAYDWSNKLGGFTTALIYYTYMHACYGASDSCAYQEPSAVAPDAMIKWALPFAKAMGPYLQHYANSVPGASYTVLGIGGGETIPWGLSVGSVVEGVKDITGKVGFAMGPITVAANMAYRPNPMLVGYDKDGKYLPDPSKNTIKDYPPAIFWLTFSWGGEVVEKTGGK